MTPVDSRGNDDFSDLFLDICGVDFGRKGSVEHIILSNTLTNSTSDYDPVDLVSNFLSRVYSNMVYKPAVRGVQPKTINPELL